MVKQMETILGCGAGIKDMIANGYKERILRSIFLTNIVETLANPFKTSYARCHTPS